jgi:two-component system, OmpR family, sensor histidine kinase MprB
VTLRARIAAVAAAVVAAAVVATAVFTYVAVRSSLRGEVDDSLAHRASDLDRFGGGPGAPGAPPPRAGLLAPRSQAFGGPGTVAQLVRPDGTVLRPPGSAAELPVKARAKRLARSGGDSFLDDAHVDGTHVRVLTRPLLGGGAVQVARSLDEVDAQLRRILLALVAVGAVGVALGGVLGALVARTALVPIARFTSRTETVRNEADLSQRMEVVGDDELARLARSFNDTLDALERSVEAQRHLVADASHELRTPIASLRANIQMLGDAERLPAPERERMHEDILGELDELTRLVGDVVELARGAKAAEVQDDVRLDQLVSTIAERERRRAPAGVMLEARDLEPTLIRGEPERIARAVTNLIGNAGKWSPPGSAVQIALADGVLSVRDHGPGFDERDLPHVFERFYRSAAARGTSGSGLGLAIVQQAAEAHGGFAEASNAPGGGALLRVGFGPILGADGGDIGDAGALWSRPRSASPTSEGPPP